jgi:hypothetical protein
VHGGHHHHVNIYIRVGLPFFRLSCLWGRII